ncbi:STAS domain-containing protein [Bacillus sp. Cr_A10]|uniref:STAS domain-containing protein n=1 Tax=Bacillus sp. Cr_A10 TaxID=3033993 RepID=UPI0023D9801F|nr:STAS domain-containing protein [Bacillus sp. Cr_A10]MDF2068245.1 STAS domain-containing protein [Bacillus sp. Cr_A10]
MSKLNEDLYNYLIENKSKITDEWITCQLLANPTYVTLKTEAYLRKENEALIEAITSIFVQNKDKFKEYIDNRAFKVAEKRATESFPIHESIQGFNNTRKVYWNFVQEFIKSTDKIVTVDDVSSWSNEMNSAFDYIVQIFSKHHYELTQKMLEYQQALILELSSPVIPIKEGIGVLPLVGKIDSQRSQIILESTLEQCTAKKLFTIFIDLSGVPILDTMVAQQLYQLLVALKLIGVEPIFSGIRPELARTALSLEIDFSSIKTYSTLSQALIAHQN